eukprot:CFRG3829T1
MASTGFEAHNAHVNEEVQIVSVVRSEQDDADVDVENNSSPKILERNFKTNSEVSENMDESSTRPKAEVCSERNIENRNLKTNSEKDKQVSSITPTTHTSYENNPEQEDTISSVVMELDQLDKASVTNKSRTRKVKEILRVSGDVYAPETTDVASNEQASTISKSEMENIHHHHRHNNRHTYTEFSSTPAEDKAKAKQERKEARKALKEEHRLKRKQEKEIEEEDRKQKELEEKRRLDEERLAVELAKKKERRAKLKAAKLEKRTAHVLYLERMFVELQSRLQKARDSLEEVEDYGSDDSLSDTSISSESQSEDEYSEEHTRPQPKTWATSNSSTSNVLNQAYMAPQTSRNIEGKRGQQVWPQHSGELPVGVDAQTVIDAKMEVYRRETYEKAKKSERVAPEDLHAYSMIDKGGRQKKVTLRKAADESLGFMITETSRSSLLPCVFISHIYPGGAASRSDVIRVGDTILAVNGVSLVGLPFKESLKLFKDLSLGTEIDLTIVPVDPAVTVTILRKSSPKGRLGLDILHAEIVAVDKGGAAEKAGAKPGHLILEVNGTSVVGWPHNRIVEIMSSDVVILKTMPRDLFATLLKHESTQLNRSKGKGF